MVFTPIEWFAFILAVFGLIKIVVILIDPNKWMNFASSIWSKPALTSFISLLLAAGVLYYLLLELTIVQIFAAMLLFMLIFAMGIAPYAKDFIAFGRKMIRRTMKDSWFYIIIWLALTFWVLYSLFI